MHAKLLQSCPTLCDPIEDSPPGSSVLGFSRQEYWSGLSFPSPIDKEGDINDKCGKELKPIKTVSYKNFILIILCSGKNVKDLDVQYCLFATLYACHIGTSHYIPASVHLND